MTAADEARAEAERIADELVLTDEVVLAAMRSTVKSEFKKASSLANGGAMVYLDDEAEAIWDEAVGISFSRWQASHSITDEQVEAAAIALAVIDKRLWSVMGLIDREQYRVFARAALEAARGVQS